MRVAGAAGRAAGRGEGAGGGQGADRRRAEAARDGGGGRAQDEQPGRPHAQAPRTGLIQT